MHSKKSCQYYFSVFLARNTMTMNFVLNLNRRVKVMKNSKGEFSLTSYVAPK